MQSSTCSNDSNPYTKHRAVIIFDWDDTICPSSFVDQWKFDTFRELPLHFQNIFLEVGRCAERCLDAASRHGTVIIITNSDDGWVKFSAERFVPNLLPCLGRYQIVSARTRYERFYPNQPLCWKAAAFAHEVNEIYQCCGSNNTPVDCDDSNTSTPSLVSTDDSNTSTPSLVSTDDSSSESSWSCPPPSSKKPSSKNIYTTCKRERNKQVISFGDSMEERTAVKIVASQLHALSKSVMFVTMPSPMQLIGQLNLLTTYMDFVCQHPSNLDLEINPEQAKKSAVNSTKNCDLLSFQPMQCGAEERLSDLSLAAPVTIVTSMLNDVVSEEFTRRDSKITNPN